jgi:hypothetical protein
MNQYQGSERQSSSTAISLITVLVIVAAAGLYLYNQNKPGYYNAANNGVYSNPSNRERTSEEIGNDLKLKEQSDPTKYFQLADVDNHFNLMNEIVLKGTVVCTSSVARFKDVKIEASYYSESNTLLGREQFPRYEIWGPGSRVTYKFKTMPPAHTKKVNVQIIGAVPTE